MVKIVLIDDHDIVRTGIGKIINEVPDFEIVGEGNCGEDALSICEETQPDIVLMDVKMPGCGGLEATKMLLREMPNIKVIVLTVCNDDILPPKLLQSGAYGYLTKDASAREMIRAIMTVHRGKKYLSSEIASILAIKSLSDEGESPFNKLSERELQVAIKVINGVEVKCISEQLNLSSKTVNSYRYRIFEKLQIKNDVELTLLAIRHGLIDQYSANNESDAWA